MRGSHAPGGLLRRALVPPAFLVLAVLAQVTLVNRLPLPGDASPDLVLLVVAALAVTGGPVPGMLAGFVGGLALDLAPPVNDLAGETALVFCAAGYACGVLAMQLSSGGANSRNPADTWTSALAARDTGLPVLASLPVMVAGVGLAEALRAGLGLMLSDPRMTGPAITHVLPGAVIYDILCCPFVLWLVAAAMGSAEPASAVLGASEPTRAQRTPSGRAVVRAAGAGGGILAGKATAVPRLTFADTRPAPLRAPVPPPPKLRLGSGTGNSLSRPVTTSGPSPRSRPLPGSHPVRVNFDSAGRDGVIGGRGWRGSALGGGFGAGFPGLGGGGFSGALGPSLFAGAGSRKPRRNWLSAGGRYSAGTLAGNARVTSGGTGVRLLAGRSVRAGGVFSSPGQGWLQILRPGRRSLPLRRGDPGRKPASPGNGWIRGRGAVATARWAKSASWSSGSTGRRSSPGKGWIRPAKPVPPARRKSPGRGWLERKPARIMWQPKSPGRGWLGRGSRPRRAGLRVQGIRAKTLGSGRTRIGGRR